MELYNKNMEKNFKMPMMYEPHRPNRWLLRFPDDFDLPEYCVNKVSNLKHYSNGKGSWKPITITLFDIIGVYATKKLIKNLNHIPLMVQLEKLDPIGVCVEKISIFAKEVDIDFGEFDYACDDLSKIKIKIIPTKVEVS
jgi:hypothetical protein